jgi:lipoprotein-releasing system ATP-binding protein
MTIDTQGAGALIEARGLTRVLPATVPVTLVKDIDFALAPGELVSITGPSGSGKSSLLYLLGLLDMPTSGEVLVAGKPTRKMSEPERGALRLAHLGFVFQFHFLLPEFTCEENVMLPMRALGRLQAPARLERARMLLHALGLEGHTHKRPDQLSGGQRQRVAIARALANAAPVLLADEPTGNLDSKSSAQVMAIMRRLVDEEGKSVVVVTHDLDFAAQADRRVHLVDGRIQSVQVIRPKSRTRGLSLSDRA